MNDINSISAIVAILGAVVSVATGWLKTTLKSEMQLLRNEAQLARAVMAEERREDEALRQRERDVMRGWIDATFLRVGEYIVGVNSLSARLKLIEDSVKC